MNLFLASRLFAVSFLALVLTASRAQTPAPGTTQWENNSLKLRLFYPADLIQRTPGENLQNGTAALFGISNASDEKLAGATHCLRPLLLLELPHAEPTQTEAPAPGGDTKVTLTPAINGRMLLAELDVSCLSGAQQHSDRLLTDMAGLVVTAPGMKSIASPSTYTIGWQKVYMSAGQGQLQLSQPNSGKPQRSVPQQLFTMGISTNWNSHLLVWYFSSNSIDTLNRMTKTTVRFGRAQAAPLYPVVIGTSAQ